MFFGKLLIIQSIGNFKFKYPKKYVIYYVEYNILVLINIMLKK